MAIDVCTKINNILKKLEDYNPFLKANIDGFTEISDYFQNLGGYNNELDMSCYSFKKLSIKSFGNFDILRLENPDTEIVMIVKYNNIVFKMISKISNVIKSNSDNDVTTNEMNIVKDTNIYLNDNHIIRNAVMSDKKGIVNYEIYASDFIANGKMQSQLDDINQELYIMYKNNVPLNINIIYYDQLLNKKEYEQIGFDLSSENGRIKTIIDINEDIDSLIEQINVDCLEQTAYIIRR